MSTDNIYIKQEIDRGMDADNITNFKSSDSSVGNISTVTMPECVYIKQEIQDNDQELNTENFINIKNEIDIEKHELLFPKMEPSTMESKTSSIKLEHEQYSHKYMPAEVDPFAVGPCDVTVGYLQSIVPEKEINSGDESVEESLYEEKTLQTHSLLLSKKKTYQCSVCNKKFSSRAVLVRHLGIHSNEKPYECTVCGKKFSMSSYLVKHSRIHTGETPVKCTVCNKKFPLSSNLVRHLRTHTGEKPYECAVCGKKFTQSSTLVSHRRTHTGEKPYQCTVCDRKFSQSSTLINHLRTHTAQKS